MSRRATVAAESTQRVTMTTLMSDGKQVQAGFTGPKKLKSELYFPGGRSISNGKQYSNPPAAAYEPHTVYLLESRYDVQYPGHGRPNQLVHEIGICRHGELEDVLARYNSEYAPARSLQLMDRAKWPFGQLEMPKAAESKAGKGSKVQGRVEIWDTLEDESDALMPSTPKLKDVYDVDPDRVARQTAAVKQRVKETGLDGIDSGVVRQDGKVPFELERPDGTYHPSGFQVPTRAKDLGKYPLPPPKAPDTRSKPDDDVPDVYVHPEQWQQVKEKDAAVMGHMLSGDFEAGTRPSKRKIPTEVSGIRDNGEEQPPQHASGFIPPTPSAPRGDTSAFTHTVEGRELDAQEIEARDAWKASTTAIREKYFKHVAETPFWRPVLSLTVSTRPLAFTLARLSKAEARGQPFHVNIDSEGRKYGQSLSSRLRCLRLQRMEDLAVDMAQILAGARGGPIGIRFSVDQTAGGAIGDPVPWNKRVIGVGIANWYERAAEIREAFEKRQDEVHQYEVTAKESEKPFVVYGVDERGKRVALPGQTEVPTLPFDGIAKRAAIPNELRAVFNDLAELTQLLREEGDHLVVHMEVSEGEEGSGRIIGVDDGTPPPPGWVQVSHTQARQVVKRRFEWLSAQHAGPIGELLAERHWAVAYP